MNGVKEVHLQCKSGRTPQLKFPRGKMNICGRFRLAIEFDAGENRTIRGRKRVEMSVFGIAKPPVIGAYRGGTVAADRPEPTVVTGSTRPKNYVQPQFSSPNNNKMSHRSAIHRILIAYFQTADTMKLTNELQSFTGFFYEILKQNKFL